jgi:hypothetical protein
MPDSSFLSFGYIPDLSPYIWCFTMDSTTSVGKNSEKTLIFLKKGIDFIENFAIIG